MIVPSAWSVRARQTGDLLLLPGGHRPVKRLMIDRRIPAADRDALPVVLCGEHIAGVLGLAVSADFCPAEGCAVLELTPEPLC